jgi:hypothetical protein
MRKHLFKGNATSYWWDGSQWRIQTKHKETIGVLHTFLYNRKYKPVSKAEQMVFCVENTKLDKVIKLMENAYKQTGEVL